MKFNVPIRWSTVLFTVIVILQFVIILFFVFYFPPTGFDIRTIKPISGFQYKNSLTCKVFYSTHQKGVGIALPWHEVKEFTLAGLNSDQPKFKTSYYSQELILRKVFESNDYLTLEYADTSWDSMTIGIMKNGGTFVQSMMGLQAGDAEFHYVIAQKGRCE